MISGRIGVHVEAIEASQTNQSWKKERHLKTSLGIDTCVCIRYNADALGQMYHADLNPETAKERPEERRP
jgi:hypothetical protein